jgi:hypothetical protein
MCVERSVRRAAAVQMSTAVGSIAENTGGGLYAYRYRNLACSTIFSACRLVVGTSGLKGTVSRDRGQDKPMEQ